MVIREYYYLNNQLFVKDGVILTIEAGTEILGRYDANYSADNPAPCLVVEQGGKVAQKVPQMHQLRFVRS